MSVSIVLYSTFVSSVSTRLPQVVREQEHAVPAEEPRPVHDVGPPAANQLDERRILLRRVFQIGVLDDHDVAPSPAANPAPQRRALAARCAAAAAA